MRFFNFVHTHVHTLSETDSYVLSQLNFVRHTRFFVQMQNNEVNAETRK